MNPGGCVFKIFGLETYGAEGELVAGVWYVMSIYPPRSTDTNDGTFCYIFIGDWCVPGGRCKHFRAENGQRAKCVGSCCSTSGWCGKSHRHCVTYLYSDNRCCNGLTCPQC